jgi:PAS domain-containing protein
MSLHTDLAAPATDTLSPEQLAELRTLASLSEQNPNPIIRLDATGRQLYANPAALALRQGLSRAEQVWVRQQLRAAVLHHNTQTPEIRVGQRYFLLQKAAIVPPEGSVTLFLAETTARVHAEQQLADQQALMGEILDTTPSIILVRDAQQQMVFENRAATKLRQQMGYLHPTPSRPRPARPPSGARTWPPMPRCWPPASRRPWR